MEVVTEKVLENPPSAGHTAQGDISNSQGVETTPGVNGSASTKSPEGADAQSDPKALRTSDRTRSYINEQKRLRHEAESERDRAKAEAAALRQKMQEALASRKPTDDPYQAVGDVARQAVNEAQIAMYEAAAERQAKAVELHGEQLWQTEAARVRAQFPDFDRVVENPNLAITPVMADALRGLERGGEVAYYLGKNPGEAARIASLSAVSQAIALADLRGSLPVVSNQVSSAPPPVKTVQGRGGQVHQSVYQEGLSMDEYVKLRSEGRIS